MSTKVKNERMFVIKKLMKFFKNISPYYLLFLTKNFFFFVETFSLPSYKINIPYLLCVATKIGCVSKLLLMR